MCIIMFDNVCRMLLSFWDMLFQCICMDGTPCLYRYVFMSCAMNAYLTLIFSGIAIQSFCNVMRQDVAFCIFLCAIKYAKERRIIHYILLCALAFCFHKSAIILFESCLLSDFLKLIANVE